MLLFPHTHVHVEHFPAERRLKIRPESPPITILLSHTSLNFFTFYTLFNRRDMWGTKHFKGTIKKISYHLDKTKIKSKDLLYFMSAPGVQFLCLTSRGQRCARPQLDETDKSDWSTVSNLDQSDDTHYYSDCWLLQDQIRFTSVYKYIFYIFWGMAG